MEREDLELRALILGTREDWCRAKARAATSLLDEGNRKFAEAVSRCDMFKGSEGLDELVRLAFSPRGIEFMAKFGFPDMQTFRRFRKYEPERLGFYIDCGDIEIKDEKRVFLVGDTRARITYANTELHRLYMMHGARAEVRAEGYAVVRIEKDEDSTAECEKRDKAVIMM